MSLSEHDSKAAEELEVNNKITIKWYMALWNQEIAPRLNQNIILINFLSVAMFASTFNIDVNQLYSDTRANFIFENQTVSHSI